MAGPSFWILIPLIRTVCINNDFHRDAIQAGLEKQLIMLREWGRFPCHIWRSAKGLSRWNLVSRIPGLSYLNSLNGEADAWSHGTEYAIHAVICDWYWDLCHVKNGLRFIGSRVRIKMAYADFIERIPEGATSIINKCEELVGAMFENITDCE